MIGQVVYQGMSNENMLINASTWSKGAYSVTLDVDGTPEPAGD